MQIFLFLLGLAVCFAASPSFEVHRLMQIDQGSQPLGSRRTAFNLVAAHATTVGDLSRRIVVLRMEECSVDLIDSLLDERNAGGLLILLPNNNNNNNVDVDEKTLNRWQAVEKALLSKERNVPIYFAVSSQELGQLESQIRAAGETATAEDFRLVVTAPEATKVSSVSLTNFQGWLAGSGTTSTIALVAHYDSFAASPTLAAGADSNGSGIVALLEIARVFHKLYNTPRSMGAYNLLFVLTAGGKLNYAGAKQWVSAADARLVESIKYALCLDSIGRGEKLFLHVSKPAKEANIVALHNRMQAVADSMNIPFAIVHKKINVSNPEVSWEHEQFARARSSARIVGGTLSHFETADGSLRSSVLDTKIDVKVLERNIRFIVEVLAAHIFELPGGTNIMAGTESSNSSFVSAWSHAVSSSPRLAPYESSKKPLLMESIFRLLKNFTADTTRHPFKLDADLHFYVNDASLTLSAFTVKPVMFDVVMSGLISLYFFVLFVGLVGWEEAVSTMKGLMTGAGSRGRRKTQKK